MSTQLERFRKDLYDWLPHRADALMDLVDALTSNTTARSVVELSLSPEFRRQYPSVHDGIENLFVPTSQKCSSKERQALELDLVRRLVVPYVAIPQQPFWLMGTDVTSAPRPFARTLPDRTFVYQPNMLNDSKPVTIGHQYSILALLPEKAPADPPWIVPLLVNRVTSTQTKRAAGLDQINRLLDDQKLPFHKDLCVSVVDSDYSAVAYLGGVARHENLVTIARLASNRNLYQSPPVHSPDTAQGKGHPFWYGAPMKLKDLTTWDTPDDAAKTTFTTRKGRIYSVYLDGWHSMLMRGKLAIPMHQHPFTLVRGQVLDEQGQMVFGHCLWLTVFGERCSELSLLQAWDSYRQRYDLEHFFRFGKQRLLMDAYQTPETQHEENWWTLVQLAYLQLWVAREQVCKLPRPWERYLPAWNTQAQKSAPPSAVQRDMERILRHFGTPARNPKRRGKSSGRIAGQRPGMRTRLPVIKKAAAKLPQRQRAP